MDSATRLRLLLWSQKRYGLTTRLRQEIELTKSSMLACDISRVYREEFGYGARDSDAAAS